MKIKDILNYKGLGKVLKRLPSLQGKTRAFTKDELEQWLRNATPKQLNDFYNLIPQILNEEKEISASDKFVRLASLWKSGNVFKDGTLYLNNPGDKIKILKKTKPEKVKNLEISGNVSVDLKFFLDGEPVFMNLETVNVVDAQIPSFLPLYAMDLKRISIDISQYPPLKEVKKWPKKKTTLEVKDIGAFTAPYVIGQRDKGLVAYEKDLMKAQNAEEVESVLKRGKDDPKDTYADKRLKFFIALVLAQPDRFQEHVTESIKNYGTKRSEGELKELLVQMKRNPELALKVFTEHSGPIIVGGYKTALERALENQGK